jgi:hypothetical protein
MGQEAVHWAHRRYAKLIIHLDGSRRDRRREMPLRKPIAAARGFSLPDVRWGHFRPIPRIRAMSAYTLGSDILPGTFWPPYTELSRRARRRRRAPDRSIRGAPAVLIALRCDACAFERAADRLHGRRGDAKPSGDLAHAVARGFAGV